MRPRPCHLAITALCGALLGPPADAATPFQNLQGADAPVRVTTRGEDTCIDYGGWIVTTRPLAEEAGTALYVERTTVQPCGSGPAVARLVFDRAASYFVGRVGRYLVVDQGTGPSVRHLAIFDSSTRRQVFHGGHAGLVGAQGRTLEFWTSTRLAATPANCPSLAATRRNGLTPAIERLQRLDLSGAAPRLRVSGTLRCTAQQ